MSSPCAQVTGAFAATPSAAGGSCWEELHLRVDGAPVLPAVAANEPPDQGEMAAGMLYEFKP